MLNPSRTLFIFLLVSSSAAVYTAAAGASHGQTCDPNTHCEVNVGLICHEQKCACGNGTFTSNLEFQMTWDAGRSMCVGVQNSACVGTLTNPVPQGMKEVHCVSDRICSQEPNLPPGLGSCKVEDTFFAPGGHGADCGPRSHCAMNVGLICTEKEKKCACGNGTLTRDVPFLMTWDGGRSLCVATPETACIGTAETPVKTGMKAVRCVRGHSCIQLGGMPLGVGTCKTGFEEEPTTTTTTTTTTPTQSTEPTTTSTQGTDAPTRTPDTSGAESTKQFNVLTFVVGIITAGVLMMSRTV